MITCSACGYDKNPDGSEFCDACGSELEVAVASTVPPTQIQPPETISQPDSFIEPQPPQPSPPQIPQPNYPIPTSAPSAPTTTTARLIAKQAGSATSEFSLDGSAIIGIFDPDMGPVEVDVEEFPGSETVSRQHAEIYPEGGDWKIKDLGSTNGVFIKTSGQTRFGARITVPTTINSGDEIAFGKVRFLFQSP